MLSAFLSAFKTPDLRKKLLFTVGMIAIYRLGATVPSPGVSYTNVQACIKGITANGSANGVCTLLNLFSGGALLQLSVFALGIMPYITASIILQLLTVVIPRLETLRKEGQSGQAKITQYTRYLTLGLGDPAGVRVRRAGPLRHAVRRQLAAPVRPDDNATIIPDVKGIPIWLTLTTLVITMTAGTGVIMWLGEMITDRGVGNGMSVLIFTSIAARLPAEGSAIQQSIGWGLFALVIADRHRGHHRGGLHRAGAAPHPGAVREAHGRPADVRRHLDLHPAEGQPGRCHPGDLRVVAALPAAARPAA